jgi:hypothetical protein
MKVEEKEEKVEKEGIIEVEEKLISNIHVKTFTGKDFSDDMRKELFADLSSAGVSADTLEKGAKRWGKEDQKIFAGAYADAFANDPDQSVRQRSLSMFARLDPGGLMEYVNNPRNATKANVSGGFAGNNGLKNAVTSMAADQIVKMKDDHLKEIAPYLSAAQIKAVGEKATDGQTKIIVEALEADPTRDIRAVKHIMTSDSYSRAVAGTTSTNIDADFQANQKAKQEYENELGQYRQHAIEQGTREYKKWKKADKAARKAGTARPAPPAPPVVPPNIT